MPLEARTRTMETAAPGADNRRALRDALGRFATGVTVVTCVTPDGPVGITANSFASVSLDPALVLWSVDRGSSRASAFLAAQQFAIHVLGNEERDLAARFTRNGSGFEGLDWDGAPDGIPRIGGTLARFDCHRHALHDGGDHVIIIGAVQHFSLRDGAPLLFSQGHFGNFAP